MQRKDLRKPYFSVHTLPQTERKVRRPRLIRKTNVKIKNLNVPKLERSRSVPNNIKFLGRVNINIEMFKSQHQQKSMKDASSPTRQSKFRMSRNPLKFSLQLQNEPTPIATPVNEPEEEVVKEAEKRKSCHCTECGKQTIFQKDTMNYGVKINQVIRDKESAMNKFKRTIRKQQTLLFPQFLNTPKNSSNSTPNLQMEEIEIMRDDLMIKSFAHRSTLSNLIFEEQIIINKSNISRQEKPRPTFFESFLQKQKQLIDQEKSQYIKQRVLLDSLQNRCSIFSNHSKIQSPLILTPKSPSSFMGSFPSSPIKQKPQKNVYLQPQKSKFFKTNSRITTLPEVPQQI